MAIQKVVNFTVSILGDGSTTVLTIDLLRDPYIINDGAAGTVENWFSRIPQSSWPIGVASNGSFYTATLNGSVITLTFGTAPTGQSSISVTLYF